MKVIVASCFLTSLITVYQRYLDKAQKVLLYLVHLSAEGASRDRAANPTQQGGAGAGLCNTGTSAWP